MGPKRPSIQLPVPPPTNQGVSITDTMTLVVHGDGKVMRVKDDGVAAPPTPSVQLQKTPLEKTDAVIHKIKFDDLRIGKEIGKGSQGKVRVVQHTQSLEKFALKYLNFEGDVEQMQATIQSELRQVEALKHPNLVSSYEAFFEMESCISCWST